MSNHNTVYLVSADMPGCGSSTLANGIASELQTPPPRSIGKYLRDELAVGDEVSLSQQLSQISDPRAFDQQFYAGISDGSPFVIDGKLATTVGPAYLDSNKPFASVDLTSHPLISAKRITQRERKISNGELIFDTDNLEQMLENYKLVLGRISHDGAMRLEALGNLPPVRPPMHRHLIDTSRHSPPEVLGIALEKSDDFQLAAPDWEHEAIAAGIQDLTYARDALMAIDHAKLESQKHFAHNLEGIKYKSDLLELMVGNRALASLRDDLRELFIGCWSSLLLKHSPRFYQDDDGILSLDQQSTKWTPEYYKIAVAFPFLDTAIRDSVILDPFAGAGTLANLIATRHPKKIFTTDLSYVGGESIDQENTRFYDPRANQRLWESMFDRLPSWYRPDHSASESPVAADIHNLPFEDDSMDYIITDPPYGINCANGGGVDLLLESLPEMKRVTKNGIYLLMPTSWLDELSGKVDFEQLTGDVSHGRSSIPTCYILINSRKEDSNGQKTNFSRSTGSLSPRVPHPRLG